MILAFQCSRIWMWTRKALDSFVSLLSTQHLTAMLWLTWFVALLVCWNCNGSPVKHVLMESGQEKTRKLKPFQHLYQPIQRRRHPAVFTIVWSAGLPFLRSNKRNTKNSRFTILLLLRSTLHMACEKFWTSLHLHLFEKVAMGNTNSLFLPPPPLCFYPIAP